MQHAGRDVCYLSLCFVRIPQIEPLNRSRIIYLFRTIDQWSASYSSFTYIFTDFGNTINKTYGHRYVKFNYVTGLPVTFDNGKSFLHLEVGFLPVDTQFYFRLLGLLVGIKSSRHKFVGSCPRRNTHTNREFASLFRLYRQAYFPIKRISRSLLQFHTGSFQRNSCLTATIKGQVNSVFTVSIHITRHLQNQTRNIRRTAGTPEPFGTSAIPMIKTSHSICFKRIDIEETITMQIDPCQRIVEK